MEKKIAYKLLNEINGKMKTFKTDEEMQSFISEKNIECPIMLKLVQNSEIEYTIDASNAVYYFIKIDVFGKGKESGEYERMNFHLNIDFKTINQTELDVESYTYSWQEGGSGCSRFDSVNEAIKNWFFGFDEEEEYFDNYYHYESSSSDCRCGGAGACIQCNPSMFI